jgi:DNA-binding transcriptional LysR family regulator
MHMVAAGHGVSLTPASSERFYGRPGVRFVPVPDVDGSTVTIACRRGSSNAAVSAFVDVAREVAGESAASGLVIA